MKIVFMIKIKGNWDGEFEDIQLFESAAEAREIFEKEWTEQKEQYLNCYDALDLVFDTSDDTCREIYLDGWYDDYHCTVSLDPVELR